MKQKRKILKMQITLNSFYDIQYIICQNNVFCNFKLFLAIFSQFQASFRSNMVEKTENEPVYLIKKAKLNQTVYIKNAN